LETNYKVQLEIFEGPLDLLLYLIKRDEVDIYDISIERVTKQYLAYVDTFKVLNITLASEFIVMAANLIYLKSRNLLPKHQQPPEEEADDDDPRWDLIRQLIEYKKFKDAAGFLASREQEMQDFFPHHPENSEMGEPDGGRPMADIGIFDLIRAFQNVLERFAGESQLNEIVDDRFTVSDKIDFLLRTVPRGGRIKFSAMFEEASTKGEVIVTFLAMLELMKLNYFKVHQDGQLGDIELQRNENL